LRDAKIAYHLAENDRKKRPLVDFLLFNTGIFPRKISEFAAILRSSRPMDGQFGLVVRGS